MWSTPINWPIFGGYEAHLKHCGYSTDAGLDVFIVTNQGGIGRGLFTENDMHRFNDHLIAEAAKQGGHIKDVAFCPHHPKAVISTLLTPCPYRKPGHLMIMDLARNGHLILQIGNDW